MRTTAGKRLFYLFFAAILVVATAPDSFGQKQKKFKAGNKVALYDSVTAFGQSDIFTFPNINKTRLYADAAKLKQLQQAEKNNNEQEMYTLLREYVKNFGVDALAAGPAL